MLTESLVEAFRTRLEALGFDLADLRIGGTPNRPLVQVRIDCPPRNVTVGVPAVTWAISRTRRRPKVKICAEPTPLAMVPNV